MYLKGIKDGKITVLFFKQKKFNDINPGDLIKIHSSYDQAKAYFVKDKIISFDLITDEIAQKAGFINVDLLAYHLINEMSIDTLIYTDLKDYIKNELFYMLVISDDPTSDDSICVDVENNTSDTPKCCRKGSKYHINNLTFRSTASKL